MRSIMVTNASHNVEYVYSPAQREELKRIAGLEETIYTAENWNTLPSPETVDFIFSTWGMIPLTEEQIRPLSNLKALFYGAGATDAFALPFLKCGIRISSAWKANAVPVAEFALGQILLSLKNYFRLEREMTSPEAWRGHENGRGIYGEKVVLLGDGAVSSALQTLLKAFHVEVIVIPSLPEKRTMSLEEAFRTGYVISNHLFNHESSRKCITKEMFLSMRKNATFINTGRGSQVDTEGMIEALKCRPDLTALLDVTDPEEPPKAGSALYALPNVRLSPHIAGSLGDEVHRMAEYEIRDFKNFTAGRPLEFEVTEAMLSIR